MKMSTQNPLSGIQSIQQAPGGLPPALAQYFQQQQELQAQQQQQASPMDQSQLAEYIKQLQDNGASPDQLQGVVQQIQQNGGQVPQPADTMQGGSGTDNIANGTPPASQMSPLSQQLNALASGDGDVNYDQISAAYPMPRQMPQMSQQDLLLQQLAKPNTGGAAGGLYEAIQGAKAQGLAQQQNINAALNARDLGGYLQAIKTAQEGGRTETARAKTEQMADYRENQLELGKQKLQALIDRGADQNEIAEQKLIIARMAAEKKADKTTGPLASNQEDQIRNASHQTLELDKTGTPIDTSLPPVKGVDLSKMEAAAGILLTNGQAKTAKQAFNIVADKVKLVNDKSGVFGGSNYRIISNPNVLDDIINGKNVQTSPQTSPNVSQSDAETIPTGGSVTNSPKEGQTATNPKTHAKLVFKNGVWSPM